MNILMIIPEDRFCPPINGGSLRVYHLLRQVGLHHDVHAVTCQSAESFNEVDSHWRLPARVQVRSCIEEPPPTNCFSLLSPRLEKALNYRWQRRSLAGPASSVFLSLAHLVEDILRTHRIDVVLFEHIEAMTLVPVVKRLRPKAIRILDAHNIDHRLLLQASQKRPDDLRLKKEMERVRRIETSLSSEIHAVIACSDDDRNELMRSNSEGLECLTIPNGVDVTTLHLDSSPVKRSLKTLLFCGSLDYEPNSDGLMWFYQEIWPLVRRCDPSIRLRVIGKGGSNQTWLYPIVHDQSIDFLGEVADVREHYQEASLSIVPLRMGSGTRLKILEAMALGTPVVSTSLGAEGIGGQAGIHFAIADCPESFAKAIVGLLESRASYDSCQSNARNLVESLYDWRIAGKQLTQELEMLSTQISYY